ncbi:MAG: transcriptional coactivator p15/PC4 family protein [archaeon]
MEKDIGKISKGEYQGTTTEIVVGIKEYNGRVGIDIREFTQSASYTGPTKKGLRIPADKFEEFKKIINSINSDDLKAESVQKNLSESPEEDSGIDESGLM